MRFLLARLAFALFLPVVACDGSAGGPTVEPPSPPTPATFELLLTGSSATPVPLRVEVAATPAARTTGLMFRESMPEEVGMLFIFPQDQTIGFWMKNTSIPLTIAYVDAGGTVLEVVEGVPFSERVLYPARPYRFAIEVNKGWFERHGLGPGAKVALPPGLPAPE